MKKTNTLVHFHAFVVVLILHSRINEGNSKYSKVEISLLQIVFIDVKTIKLIHNYFSILYLVMELSLICVLKGIIIPWALQLTLPICTIVQKEIIATL